MSSSPSPIRFLPSYVGSKRHWLPALDQFRGRPFVELFAGSAVLSANLASRALLVDSAPVVARILSRFPEQIVPTVCEPETITTGCVWPRIGGATRTHSNP